MTALTLYPLMRQATATLSTASACATSSGSFPVNTGTICDTSLHYGQMYPLGRNVLHSWAAATSIPAPDGNGWLWDVSTLSNQQISYGAWTITLSFNSDTGPTCDIHFRAFRRTSSASFFLINEWIQSSVTFTAFAGVTVCTLSSTVQAQNFGSGDQLYFDCWPNLTSNSGGYVGEEIYLYGSDTANQGTADMVVSTPGYVPYVAPVIATETVIAMARDGKVTAYARDGKVTAIGRDGKITAGGR